MTAPEPQSQALRLQGEGHLEQSPAFLQKDVSATKAVTSKKLTPDLSTAGSQLVSARRGRTRTPQRQRCRKPGQVVTAHIPPLPLTRSLRASRAAHGRFRVESGYHEHRQDLETLNPAGKLPCTPFPGEREAGWVNYLAETPRASCGSRADSKAAPGPPRPDTKQPDHSRVLPAKVPHAHTPAGCRGRLSPVPQGGGAHVQERPAPRLHAPAPPAPASHRSAALGYRARPGLRAPAAHCAPSLSSPGPAKEPTPT